jgi:hypothetical protein
MSKGLYRVLKKAKVRRKKCVVIDRRGEDERLRLQHLWSILASYSFLIFAINVAHWRFHHRHCNLCMGSANCILRLARSKRPRQTPMAVLAVRHLQ